MQTPSLADYFQTKPPANKAGKADADSPVGPSFDAAFHEESAAKIRKTMTDSVTFAKDSLIAQTVSNQTGLRVFSDRPGESDPLILANEQAFENTVPFPDAGPQIVNVAPDPGLFDLAQLMGTEEPLNPDLLEQGPLAAAGTSREDPEFSMRGHGLQMTDQPQTLLPPDNLPGTIGNGQSALTEGIPRSDLGLRTGPESEKGFQTKSLVTNTPDAVLTSDQNAFLDTQFSATMLNLPASDRQSVIERLMLDGVKGAPDLDLISPGALRQAVVPVADDAIIGKVADPANGLTSEPVVKDGVRENLVSPTVSPTSSATSPDQPVISQLAQSGVDGQLRTNLAQPKAVADTPVPIQAPQPSENAPGFLSAHRPDATLPSAVKNVLPTDLFGLNFPKAQVELMPPAQTLGTGDMTRMLRSDPNSNSGNLQSNSVNPQPPTLPIPNGLTTTYHVRLAPQSPPAEPVQSPLQQGQQAALTSEGPQVASSSAQGSLKVYSPPVPINAPFGPNLQLRSISSVAAKDIMPPQVTPTPAQTPVTATANTNPAATLQALVANPAIQPLSREERTMRDGKELTPFGMSHQISDTPITQTIRPAADTHMPRHVAQQLIAAANLAPDRPVEIALNPEELGRVRMTLHPSDGGMQVVLIADRPETTDLFRRNIEVLANEFRELGYTSVTFTFSGNDSGRDSPMTSRGTADPEVPQDAPDQAPLTPTSRSIAPNGSVDLRL